MVILTEAFITLVALSFILYSTYPGSDFRDRY